MGMDMTCLVEVRERDTNKWKIVPIKVQYKHYVPSDASKPYVLDKTVLRWCYASPWTGRDYELFDVLEGGNSNSVLNYNRGLPCDVSKNVYMRHEEFKVDDTDRFYCFSETWYTLAELEAALSDKKKYPKWIKYKDENSSECKERGVRTSLKEFVLSVRQFVDMYGWYDSSDVRVILWFSC